MTDIFIRTYHKDLDWLAYCLRSIHKFCTGYGKIIVCIPRSQKPQLDKMNLTSEVQVYCDSYVNDYVGQQITKISAWQYSSAEHILFVDSDCCFNKPVNIGEFFFGSNGIKRTWFENDKICSGYTNHTLKPIIYKRPFSLAGDAICWKAPTEQVLGTTVEWECMCRLPIIHSREVLQDAWNFLNMNGTFERLLKEGQKAAFSEFNVLGNFALQYHQEKYYFVDAHLTDTPEAAVKQSWSWGGLTEQIKGELENLLR